MVIKRMLIAVVVILTLILAPGVILLGNGVGVTPAYADGCGD